MRQEPCLWEAGAADSKHTDEEGQSPHEQPKDESPHEWTVTFIGFIPDEWEIFDRKSIAYGDPISPTPAFLPINANHSTEKNQETEKS